MKPRPKPLVGLLLGLLLGVVVVGLLWQLGVAPPDRFILFGVIALSIAVVDLMVTQTVRRGKKRFVTVMIIAGVFGGVALTGIPETFMGAGTVSDGCTLEATSGDETVKAADTSAFEPLDTTPTGTISWESSTEKVLTNWDSGLGMYIGGVAVPLFTAERPNSEQATSWSSTEEVADYLNKLEDEWGVQLRGTYHVYGYIHADEGDCDMAAYIRVNAENPFATPLIIALWVATGLLAVIIIALTVSVRRSIREAKAYAKQAALASSATGTLGTGGSAAMEPVDAVEPVGAFTEPPKAAVVPPVVDEPAEPVAETQVMPAAETEALPVNDAETGAAEPGVVEPGAAEPGVVEPAPVEPAQPDDRAPQDPAPASDAGVESTDEEPKNP